MDKPIIYYEVRQHVNRITGAPVYVPAIVEREQAIPLDEIIRRAIDRGLIAGLKTSAAKQIADAIAQQMYDEFVQGRGVKFGNYFYARLYLSGTSDPNGTLTAANGVNVRFVNGAAFRLTMDMFSFSNVATNYIPKVEFLLSAADNAERGFLISGEAIQVNGLSLYRDGDVGTKVEFFEVDPETGLTADTPTATVTAFTNKGPNQLVFDWVDALVATRKYRAVPSRSADGTRWFTGNSAEATIVAAA